MRKWLQHRLNGQHLYCRMRDCGLPRGLALFLAALIGKCAKPLAYGRTLLPAALLFMVLLAAACTSCAPASGPGGQIDPARIQAGVMYLETTLATVEGGVAVAKAKYPDKAQAIDAQVGPVVSELRVAISAFRSTASAGDYSKATTAWDVARPLVSTAISVAAPYALGALVK